MKSLLTKFLRPIYTPVNLFYGPEGEGEGNTEGEGGDGSNIGLGGNSDDDELPPSAKGKQTFTQAEFSKALAEDRRKHKARVEEEKKQKQKIITDLENVKKSKGLTEKERDTLQQKIEELQNSLLTKEQLTAKEREKLENTHKQAVSSLTGERDSWKNRFTSAIINQAIIGEASVAEAFNPEDLIFLLSGSTRLVEETDESGNPLEKFVPKVKFNDQDKDGKPVTLDLTVAEAVKRMKDLPRYAHLFKSTAAGGLGGNSGTGGKGGQPDPAKMTTAQFREWRKKNK